MTSTVEAAAMANGEQATRISLIAMVTRILSSLGCAAVAALALVVLAPVGAQAGQPVNQPYTCPGGSFLTGLQGHAGDWLDQFQPVCRSLSFVQIPHTFPKLLIGPESEGDDFGNVNGGSTSLSLAVCAPDSAVFGIEYDIVSPNGPPGHVRNVVIRCASAPSFADPHDYGLDSPSDNPGAGTHFDCPNGEFANGIVIGLDGVNITSLSLECVGPTFSITKKPAGSCLGPLDAGGYTCVYIVTVTNTGIVNYSGPVSFTDTSGYQDASVKHRYDQTPPFSCTGAGARLDCTETGLAAGDSAEAWIEFDVSADDAAKSSCGNAANSATLTAPVQVGPVWAHSTLPAESGCLPNGTVTNGPVPPLCPADWYEVVDPSRLPANYERQTITFNGMSILCARRKISASDIIKLTQPPCPPLSHLVDGHCVPNIVLVPINPTPPSGSQCRIGTVKIGRNCVATCPDGSVMPANRYCGPKIILRKPDQRLACLNGQLRDIRGNCPQTEPATCPFGEIGTPPNCHRILGTPKDTTQPQTPSPTINLHNVQKLLACPDGQLRLKNGQCPPPKIKIRPFMLNNTPTNNGLH